MIFINLLATPPPYAGHDFAINSAGPKNSASAPRNFIHIRASWHQVTQTCRQIYLESYRLFFASDSYYLANLEELKRFLRWSFIYLRCFIRPIRLRTITTLCLEGLVKECPIYSKKRIDELLSDPNRRYARSRQELEARTFKWLDVGAADRLEQLPNLRTVGLRMRVGEEMHYVNFMYGVSDMRRGLVEFVDQSHWLIRNQHPNDVWRIQYACFTMADFQLDENGEHISHDRRRIEEKVTEIDSRAPGLQEGDERYVEVQIQRLKRDDDVGTTSEVSDVDHEDLFDTRPILRSETSDLNTTQVEELQDIAEPTHEDVEIELEEPPIEMEDDLEYRGIQLLDGVEIELKEPPMEMDDDLDYQAFQPPAHDRVETELKVPPLEMDDDLRISPLDNNLGGNELEQEVLNRSELFIRSSSQDKHDSQSNEHSDQDNDHALSETPSHEVSTIQSTEPTHQQAEESLLPTYSTFAWHSVLTNTDSSRKFQTDSDDEDSNLQDKCGLGDQVTQSTQNKEAKAERHRKIRKRLLRQVQQPLSRFSDIPFPHTPEGMGSFREWQELADLNNNEQTETDVRDSIQSPASEKRDHDFGNPGATNQKAPSIEKQPVTAIPEWIWSLFIFFQIWIILLTFCYLCVLVIFLTASLRNLHGN